MQSLNNVEFLQVGLARIQEAADLDIDKVPDRRSRASVAAIDDATWQVTLTDGTQVRPRLLIGADGAQSRVRDQLGFRCRTWAYDQCAIVTTVTSAKPHSDVARQVFLETGPLAFLPLRPTTEARHSCISSIVWSLDTTEAKKMMALDDTAFRAQLARAFEYRLGDIVASDRRFSFPLTQNHAVDYVLPGVALIGDAAHTIHPLAGQGINLGFLDAAVLAEEILQAHSNNGLSIDDFSVLRKYQRRRKPHNLMLMSAMEGFKRLFGLDVPPVRIARNLGLSFFNRHSFIKQEIMQRAMGLHGDLPALAQPGLIADF
jgi:2-octaprenylphenol hydroxylase